MNAGVAAHHATMSHLDWLTSREPAAPPELTACVAQLIASRPDWARLSRVDAFIAASEQLLRRVLESGAVARANALDLLAADACVTWAFEAAADDPRTVAACAERAIRRDCGDRRGVRMTDRTAGEGGRRAVAHLRDLSAAAAVAAETLGPAIEKAAGMVRDVVRRGGTLFFCGNGGSAADAQHMATEYVVRYKKARRAIGAVALTTDTSALTAIGNDFSFDQVFSRQVEALCRPGDLLILHTTSGNSANLIQAADAARKKGVATLALSAKGGGALATMVDHCIVVPTDRTDRAQEIQLNIEHSICEMIDDEVADG